MKEEKVNNISAATAMPAEKSSNLDYDAEKEDARIRQILAEMTLFDDDLMSKVFESNKEATELLLSIILDQSIKVIRTKGQYELKSPEVKGRNVRLDIFAKDANGRHINVEVQGNREGAHVRRARYNSAMLDSHMLKANQPYKDMKDSYTIFMYRDDMFGLGLPLYHIERYIVETMQPVDDGNHIIYLNGKYKGDDKIGRLISDFNQKDGNKMYYKALADSVKHFKEEEEAGMCDLVKTYGDEREMRGEARGEARNLSQVITTMHKNGFSAGQIAAALDKNVDEVEAILSGKSIELV